MEDEEPKAAATYILREVEEQRSKRRKIVIIGLAILLAVVIFVLGFLAGYFATSRSHSTQASSEKPETTAIPPSSSKAFQEKLVSSLRADSLEQFAR